MEKKLLFSVTENSDEVTVQQKKNKECLPGVSICGAYWGLKKLDGQSPISCSKLNS